MFHKIEATIAKKEDSKGNPIARNKLKYRHIKLEVFSVNSRDALTKAGKKLTAEGYVVGDINKVNK